VISSRSLRFGRGFWSIVVYKGYGRLKNLLGTLGSHPAIPRPQRLIPAFPLRPATTTIRATSLKPTPHFPNLALRLLAKWATSGLWNSTPVFVLLVFVANWRDPRARFSRKSIKERRSSGSRFKEQAKPLVLLEKPIG
jgi:hypothetical protein